MTYNDEKMEKLEEEILRKINELYQYDISSEEYEKAVANLAALEKLLNSDEELAIRDIEVKRKKDELDLEIYKAETERLEYKRKMEEKNVKFYEAETERLKSENGGEKLTPKKWLFDNSGQIILAGAGLAQVIFIVWAEKHDLSVITTKAIPFVGKVFDKVRLF